MESKNNVISFFTSPYILLSLAALFWSGNFILGRAVRADVPPIALAFYRWVLATLIALALSRPYLKKDFPLIKKNWKILIFLSITGIATFNTLVYIGLQYTIAVNGLLLQSMIPVVIAGLTFLFFKEKFSIIQLFGIAVSLTGVAIIICKGSLDTLLAFRVNKGDILIFIAVVGYAIYSVGLKKRPLIHPFSFIATTFFLGVVCLLPLYIWEMRYIATMELNRATLLSVLYVSIFPSIVSYLCYNRGVELVGPAKAGMFIHLMPVFGSIMAVVFLGESFKLFHFFGIFSIACGILLTTRFDRSKK